MSEIPENGCTRSVLNSVLHSVLNGAGGAQLALDTRQPGQMHSVEKYAEVRCPQAPLVSRPTHELHVAVLGTHYDSSAKLN